MTQALKRHNEGNTVVIPIILRPVDLRRAPFNTIQLLPTDAKPVTKWMNQDDAFLSMIHSIEDVVQKRFLQSQTLQKTKEQWFDEGKLHYESKHYEEALVALEQVALLDPQDAPSHLYKGITLQELQRYDEALAAEEQAIFLDPTNARYHCYKGGTLRSLKCFRAALVVGKSPECLLVFPLNRCSWS